MSEKQQSKLLKNKVDIKISADLGGRDRIVVGFISTYAISAYHH